MAIKYLVLILVFLATIDPLFALENRTSSWLSSSYSTKLSEDWGAKFGVEVRYSFDDSEVAKTKLKSMAATKIGDGHTLGIGLQYAKEGDKNEGRVVAQSKLDYLSSEEHKLFHRLRVESRFFSTPNYESLRGRYALGYDYILSDTLTLLVWDELFLTLVDSRYRDLRFVDKNRFMLGIRVKRSHYSMRIAYMNQLEFDSNRVSEHIAVFQLDF